MRKCKTFWGEAMKSNKKTGSDFEQDVCQLLADQGYWVHNFANRANGQPVDIIAARMGRATIIDAKVCSKGYFETRRLEENQILSMRKWFACKNFDAFLFFLLPDESIYSLWIKNDFALNELLDKKRLTETEIRELYCWRKGGGNNGKK